METYPGAGKDNVPVPLDPEEGDVFVNKMKVSCQAAGMVAHSRADPGADNMACMPKQTSQVMPHARYICLLTAATCFGHAAKHPTDQQMD
jgi:hypothetical protein